MKKFDNFIHNIQLEFSNSILFEWIPYNQFNEIKKTGSNNLYSAMWKDGPLYRKDKWSRDYTRDSNKEVILKFSYNSKDPIEFVINEV
jgi:hypothetical protein